MNNRGFTLVELLAVLVIIGVIFGVTFYLLRGTTASTLTQMDDSSDNMIFESARAYVLENNIQFNRSGYVCVSLGELVDYGYLDEVSDTSKIIKLKRNFATKVIEEIKYVPKCN